MQITKQNNVKLSDLYDPATESSVDWKQRSIPAALILFAFLVRILYLFTMRNHPWIILPFVDEIDYDHLARMAVLNGLDVILPSFRPPLWPWLLAGVYKVFGDQFLFARLLNAALGALSIGSLYRLSLRLYGRKISLLTGIVAALAGIVIHFQTTALATSLLLLLLFEAMIASIDFRRHPSRTRAMLMGSLWALALMTRPIALLPALLFLADALYRAWKNRTVAHKRDVLSLLLALLAFAVVLSPVFLLNTHHGGSPIAANTGINFYLGNRTSADGVSPTHPVFGPGWRPEQAKNWSEEQSGKELSAAEGSSWYINRTIDEWKQAPVAAFRLLAKKTLLSFSGVDLSNNGDLTYLRSTRSMLMVTGVLGTWWIVPFGLLGMVFVWRRSSGEQRLVMLSVLVVLLATAFVFVTTRFRLPAILLLIPYAIIWLSNLAKHPRMSTAALRTVVLSILVLILLNGPARYFAPAPNPAYGMFLDGQLFARAHMRDKAEVLFRQALKENPSTPLANQSIGFLRYEKGDLTGAEQAFHAELHLRPSADSFRGLGLINREQENHQRAAQMFRRAVEIHPWEARLKLLEAEETGAWGLDLFGRGELDSARELFHRAEQLNPDNPFYAFGRACCSWVDGDTVRAVAIMDSLRVRHPDYNAVRDWFESGWRP